jgi:predicted O-methyltransferase YrrM
MSQDDWTAVDRYLAELLVPADPGFAGLPASEVTPLQGRLLEVLAKLRGARMILELGTLAGYSTIWLARALPTNGRLIAIGSDPRLAELARSNVESAGFDRIVDVREGPALEILAQLAAERAAAFDLVFIAAGQSRNAEYLRWALELSRPGTLIVAGNVVRDGAVADPEFFELLASDERVDAAAFQTVGANGWDGLALGLVERP